MNWIVEMMRIYRINPLVPMMVTVMNGVDVHDGDQHLHDDDYYDVVVGEQWETTGDDEDDGEGDDVRPEKRTRMDDGMVRHLQVLGTRIWNVANVVVTVLGTKHD